MSEESRNIQQQEKYIELRTLLLQGRLKVELKMSYVNEISYQLRKLLNRTSC